MHPAFSVIFLTTLIGVGQGLFLALYTSQLYSVVNVLPVQDPHKFYGLGSLLALLLLVGGLNPVLFSFSGAFTVDLSLVVGGINTLLAFTLFFCTAMIYACVKFLQEWATPLTVVNYMLLGSASGFTLAAAFAAYVGSDLVTFYGAWAIIITLAAFVTRSASLLRNARIKYKSSLRSAIGIRHARIEQKSRGFMGGAFNTREYFHGASARSFSSVKWLFLVLVFPLPVVLLVLGLGSGLFVLLVGAFIVQYLGLLAERWFFFAQANHPQNLYYQTV